MKSKGAKRVKSFRLDDFSCLLIERMQGILEEKDYRPWAVYSEGDVVTNAIKHYYNYLTTAANDSSRT